MSITEETARERAKDCAVLCCRAEEGTMIQVSNLEDPAIFDDLIDSGLLELEGALTIEQVLGARLTRTCDALCPLTPDLVEGIGEAEGPDGTGIEGSAVMANASYASLSVPGGVLKIHIGEGKDIDIELPVGLASGAAESEASVEAKKAAGEMSGRRPGKTKTVLIKEVTEKDTAYQELIDLILQLDAKETQSTFQIHADLCRTPVCVSIQELMDLSIEEPEITEVLADQEADLCGMILVETPQSGTAKEHLMRRVSIMTEMMDAERTIVISKKEEDNKK